MFQDRRSRYQFNQPPQQQRVEEKRMILDIKFDISELDLMCCYIISSSKYIKRGHIINMRNVFNMLDMSAYGNDQDCTARIQFILKGITARLEKNLTDGNIILRDITGGIGAGVDSLYRELSYDEIAWVNDSMEEIIKWASIQFEAEKGLELITRIAASKYKDRGNTVKEFEQWITATQNTIRRVKVESAEDQTFSLMGERFIEAMRETYRQVTSNENRLVFGSQGLNLITGGGLEADRVYIILGLPGEGKSSTLLDMAIQIKKYNTGYRCKDPTKRPCVVLLVMENSFKETIERLYSMCVFRGMENYSEEEFIERFKESGFIVSDDSPIDLIIKVRPNLSEDTSYLYTLCDNLEDEGYEVIAVLQDYLKRIRSVEGNFGGDLRMQLGAVTNEFHTFATIKHIPLVSASQLNRVATTSIDVARTKEEKDLVKILGRGNVGDSNLILENADWVGLIAPEFDPETGLKYLGVSRVKSRYYIAGDYQCIFMPYIENTIKLTEDVGCNPTYKITMKSKDDESMKLNGCSSNVHGMPTIRQMDEAELYKNTKNAPKSTDDVLANLKGATVLKSTKSIVFPENIQSRSMCEVVVINPMLRQMCTLI